MIHNNVRANRFRVCGTRPRDTRNKDVTQQPGEGDYAAAATGSVKSPPNPKANREEEEEEEERKRGRWSCSGVVALGGPTPLRTTQRAHKNRIDSSREINHVKLKSRGLSGTYIRRTKHYHVTGRILGEGRRISDLVSRLS